MNSFRSVFDSYHWQETHSRIYQKTAADVEKALNSNRRSLDDFQALVSPAAMHYLEEMAQLSPKFSENLLKATLVMRTLEAGR